MVNKTQLEKGIKIELSDKHTTSRSKAKKIAMEHLEGNKDYYKEAKTGKNKMNKLVAVKKELTKCQIRKLKEHSMHHTKKHIEEMKKQMLKGKKFNEAHKLAQKY